MDSVVRQRLPWLTLILFTLLFTLGNIDRALVSVLAEPIRREFLLSDTQIGLLTGLAFAIPYTIAGIPMGRLIDRGNRVGLVAIMMTLWSGLTATVAMLHSFSAMVAVRAALGASEAGQAPALTSLVSDIAPAERRGSAVAFLYLSTPLGIILGFAFGSVIAAHFGWRTAFLAAAAPGFLLAAITWLCVREPARGGADGRPDQPSDVRGFGAILRADSFLLLLIVACGVAVAGQVGISAFLAPFLMRVHGLGIAEAGMVIAATYGVGGLVGIAGGGVIGDWLNRKSDGAALICVAAFNVAAAGFAIAAVSFTQLVPGLIALVLYSILCVAYYGPVIGAYVTRLPADRRGVGMAVLMIVMNLVGYGLGPQLSGFLSDLFRSLGFADSLRPALAATAGLYAVSACALVLAARRSRREAAAGRRLPILSRPRTPRRTGASGGGGERDQLVGRTGERPSVG